MTIDSLKFISDTLTGAGINYEFWEWTSPVTYPYFVGEYSESEPVNEDGMQESEVILNGFTREAYLELETAKSKIEKLFSNMATILPNGNGLAIFYAGSFVVPTGDEELKKIEIHLRINEWKVN